MTYRRRTIANLYLLPLATLMWAQLAWAGAWQVDHGQSMLGFVASYDEIPIEARFEEYSAEIVFEPAAIQENIFNISISVDTVNSDSEDRDRGMLDAEWFDSARYPTAIFRSTGFRRINDSGAFEVVGNLSIKSATRPVTVPFTWETNSNLARLRGRALVKRTDFDIGTGDWETDDTIGFDVEIVFDLILSEGH